MKLSGDVFEEQKELAKALEDAEQTIDDATYIPKERRAQALVCLAHDWYSIDCDEEGNRLLLKAEKVSPGYFKGPVVQHQKEDENFDTVVKNITLELINLMIGNLNDEL